MNKKSLLGTAELERLKLKPIEMMRDVFDRALKAYDEHRGVTDKHDPGPAYLSVAGQIAAKMAGFRYPTLSAIAVKDVSEVDRIKPLTTAEAIEIIRNDPFSPPELSNEIAMLLPEGNKDE